MRVQRYALYFKPPNFSPTFFHLFSFSFHNKYAPHSQRHCNRLTINILRKAMFQHVIHGLLMRKKPHIGKRKDAYGFTCKKRTGKSPSLAIFRHATYRKAHCGQSRPSPPKIIKKTHFACGYTKVVLILQHSHLSENL